MPLWPHQTHLAETGVPWRPHDRTLPDARRVAPDDAPILSQCANPAGWDFRERQPRHRTQAHTDSAIAFEGPRTTAPAVSPINTAAVWRAGSWKWICQPYRTQPTDAPPLRPRPRRLSRR